MATACPLPWLGHPVFKDREGRDLTVRADAQLLRKLPRPADGSGRHRASRHPLPPGRCQIQPGTNRRPRSVSWGGLLNGQTFSDPAQVRQYARKAQLGEPFDFDRTVYNSDGAFRNQQSRLLRLLPRLLCPGLVLRPHLARAQSPLPGCLLRHRSGHRHRARSNGATSRKSATRLLGKRKCCERKYWSSIPSQEGCPEGGGGQICNRKGPIRNE